MAPTHPKLVWPRSDGLVDRHPAHSSDKTSGWFDKLEPGHPKYTMYGEKVGKHIAEEVLGLKGLNKPRIDMPDGYALYVHKKPQADKSLREDVYLFGSPVSKFRSPQEFIPHAEWLFDTTKSLKDHSKCGCKYNSKSAIALDKKRKSLSATGLPAPKRVAHGSSISTPEPQVEPIDELDPVVPERAIDQTTKRRFRKGELVFFRIATIPSPKSGDLSDITHWPALVASITQRTKLATDGSGKGVHTFEHSLRPLGMFANSYEVTRDTSDVLPFSASVELLGGLEGWSKIGRESRRVLNEGIERETQIDIPPAQADIEGDKLEHRWKRRWGERIRFTDLPLNWDAAIVRLGVALRMARNIASCWSQTDKFELIPSDTMLSQKEVDDIENRKKTLYQGLWYQGERVWMDDIVRLRKNRSSLPNGSLDAPSPGAEDRGVFLRIRLISLEHQAATDSSKDMWRCMLYGDLYELSERPAPGAPDWKPPKGLYYRKINNDGCEVTLDVFDVAGRVYGDLLEKSSAWFYDPNSPADSHSGRVPADDGIMQIVGLKPSTRQCDCNTWKEDLYVMVREATQDMEKAMREYYGRLLAKALGFKSKAASSLNGNSQAPNSPAGPSTPTTEVAKSSVKTPIFQCDPADVSITPSPGNRLQSPSITVGPNLKPALGAAAEHLRAGRTVAFPTETVYGLGAHSLDPSAVAKIYAIKNRPSDNPLIMHISTLDMLQRLLPPGYQLSELCLALIEAFWPGPLTLLFPSANPPAPPAPQTNAIRMPNHPLALALIATADLPVSAPSANSSGRPSPTRATHVAHDLDGREGLGCILDGGPCGVGVESTVVDALAWQKGRSGSINILRPGGLGVEDIARVVKEVDGKFDGGTDILIQGKPWRRGSVGGGAIKIIDNDLPPSTPGMKYRHYSPTIPVHLLLPSNVFPRPAVTGPTTDPAGVVKALAGDKRVGFLHFDGSPLATALAGVQDVKLERRSLGKDASSAAQHLFDGMLSLEEAGVEAILIEGCADDGLGLAVMERVGKAVGGGGVTGALDNGQVSTPGQEGRYWVEV